MNTETSYRTRTLDHIIEGDVGKTLKVAGWVENIRDHGGVSFIDLRDMYGVLQVVIRNTELLDGISKEDCVSIEGPIEHRDLRVISLLVPFLNRPGNGHGLLLADAFQQPALADHHLHHSIHIPDIKEGYAAMVTDILYPAGNADCPSNVTFGYLG